MQVEQDKAGHKPLRVVLQTFVPIPGWLTLEGFELSGDETRYHTNSTMVREREREREACVG